MNTECILLTGGASRRMGFDKSKLKVNGQPIAALIATSLTSAGYAVTVLGREPVAGFALQLDAAEFEGPLAALAAFEPKANTVFVAACDMPRFDPEVVPILSGVLDRFAEAEVAVPVLEGRRQPLCALYRKSAWTVLPGLLAERRRSMMAWLDAITVHEVFETEFQEGAVDPASIRSVNTPEELDDLLRKPKCPPFP